MLDLTFDDGPSIWTPAILDVLAEYGRTATFFVVGANVSGHEKTLQRMVAEGHTVGNHTFSHRRLTEIPADEIGVELRSCRAAVERACGVETKVWRPPYLTSSSWIDRVASAFGMDHRGGGIDPLDWKHSDYVVIAETVITRAHAGATVCLHDGIPPDGGNGTDSRQATVDALRVILEAGW